MFERKLNHNAVITAINLGGTIIEYPDDQPYPSRLLLYIYHGLPVHVVVARDKKDYACYVVTAYIPDSRLWGDDFKTRIQ